MYFLIACLFNILGFLLIDSYIHIEFGSHKFLAIFIAALLFNLAGSFSNDWGRKIFQHLK